MHRTAPFVSLEKPYVATSTHALRAAVSTAHGTLSQARTDLDIARTRADRAERQRDASNAALTAVRAELRRMIVAGFDPEVDSPRALADTLARYGCEPYYVESTFTVNVKVRVTVDRTLTDMSRAEIEEATEQHLRDAVEDGCMSLDYVK